MSSNFFGKIIGSDPHSLLEKAVQISPLDKGQKIIAKIFVKADKISSEKPAETIDPNQLGR